MKLNYRKILGITIFFFIIMGLSCYSLTVIFPKAPARWHTADATVKEANAKEVINYTALGDSLTEGVGDATKQGGFVNLLASDIKDYYGFNAVGADNFGVSGDRSDQIIKRVKNDEDLQKSLKQADFITITVGGNDLMKVFRSNFFNLTVKKFDKPQKQYQKRLENLFELIRELNPDAPIYVLGIYNPYYVNFPDVKEMQQIFDNWNKGTQKVVEEQADSYFIPINDLLYKGINGDVGIADSENSSAESSDETDTSDSPSESKGLNTITNDALYEGDNFHPNNLGYQLMSNAVKEKLIDTQDLWLPKEEQ